MDARLAWARIGPAPDAVRVVARDAVGLNEIRAEGRDDLRDLNVRVIDRCAESRHERGREHESYVLGLADLGLQLRVTANPAVVLPRGRGGCRRSGEGNSAGGERALGRSECRSRAEIATAIQSYVGRLKKLRNVGCAHGSAVAAPQPNIADRRPRETDLVGVRLEAARRCRVAG